MTSFHPNYEHLIAGLPPSQIAEAYKRLTTGRQAIPADAVAELGERQEAVLTAVSAAYARKKERSRAASQRRRDAVRSTTAGSAGSADDMSVAVDMSAELPPIELPPIELMTLDDAAPAAAPADVSFMKSSTQLACQPADVSSVAPVAPVAPAPVAPAPTSQPMPTEPADVSFTKSSADVPEKVVATPAGRRGRKLFASQH